MSTALEQPVGIQRAKSNVGSWRPWWVNPPRFVRPFEQEFCWHPRKGAAMDWTARKGITEIRAPLEKDIDTHHGDGLRHNHASQHTQNGLTDRILEAGEKKLCRCLLPDNWGKAYTWGLRDLPMWRSTVTRRLVDVYSKGDSGFEQSPMFSRTAESYQMEKLGKVFTKV
jgi:hypothetical protein